MRRSPRPMRAMIREEGDDGVAAPTHTGADPRVPTPRRCARRTAPTRTSFAPACGMGRSAGQHAPSRGPVDPRARRGHRVVNLGGPFARPGLGAPVPRLRHRGARRRGLHAREVAGGWQDAADGRRPCRSPPRFPRWGPHAVRRGRARDRRAWQRPPLRCVDRHGPDPVGGSATSHHLDGAAARGSTRSTPSSSSLAGTCTSSVPPRPMPSLGGRGSRRGEVARRSTRWPRP